MGLFNNNAYGYGGLSSGSSIPGYDSLSAWGTPNNFQDPVAQYGFGSENILKNQFADIGGMGANPYGITSGGAADSGGFMSGLGGFMKDYGAPLLGAAQGLGGLFMGMKQYGLAKDALNAQRKQYEQNYAAQRQMTNAQLEDRQRARVAASASAEDVDSYMARNGIK